MEDLGLVILLGGFLLVCLHWGIPKFLKWVRLQNGVITDGHIWAHRQVVIRDSDGPDYVQCLRSRRWRRPG